MTEDTIQSDFYIAVATKLKIARQIRGVDQESLAQMLGLTRTSIINIEKGRQRPSVYQLWLIARFLHIPILDLIPTSQLHDKLEVWKAKVENNAEIDNQSDQNVLINFISATRQTI